jgi:hypothetical protein
MMRLLSSLIARPSPPPQLQLFDIRSELSSLLIAHLKTEDWLLYPPLLASADSHIASVARAFSVEMGGLAAAFRVYCAKWGANAIVDNWAGYCGDSRHLIDVLTTRITRENRELYPLLDRLKRAA